MTLKPSIASPEVEFDARSVAGVPEDDWDQTVTWPDTAGKLGGPFDGTGAGGTRRFEEFGVRGTLPQVRCRGTGSTPARQDRFSFDAAPFINSNVTFFAVVHAISLTNHLPIIGSSVASTPPRIWSVFAKSNGAIVFTRGTDPYDVISATGVIVAGGLYVITARAEGTTMILRVNGVQVGVNASAGSVLDWASPRLFEVKDTTTGGVGDTTGRDKAAAWISGYSSAASDQDVIDMEGFLADRFSVPGVVSPTASKPAIASPQIEYDVNSLGALGEGDTVAPWDDQTVNGNDAIAVGTPEMDLGGWLKDGGPAVRMTLPNGQVNFTDPGFGGEDEITCFWVFRLVDMSATNVLTGGTSFTSLTQIEAFVTAAGKVTVSFGTDEGVLAVSSADGEILPDTDYVLSFTHSSTDGKILRKKVLDVNGVQIGANPASTGNLIVWSGPQLCNIVDVAFAKFMKYMWFSGYTSLASVGQLIQMEEFLAETFLGQSPLAGFPRDVPPRRVGGLFNPGAVKRRTNAGLTQIRSLTAIGWSWTETFPLLRVSDPDHVALTAFIKNAWHAGQIFKAVHPLRPGSGLTPNGLGTANVMVVGAGQTGNSVLTDGWPINTVNCVVAGDVISIGGEVAVYEVVQSADSNGTGEVTVLVNPNLRSSPADNALVTTTDVEFVVTILDRSRFESAQPPNLFADYQVTFGEALL